MEQRRVLRIEFQGLKVGGFELVVKLRPEDAMGGDVDGLQMIRLHHGAQQVDGQHTTAVIPALNILECPPFLAIFQLVVVEDGEAVELRAVVVDVVVFDECQLHLKAILWTVHLDILLAIRVDAHSQRMLLCNGSNVLALFCV